MMIRGDAGTRSAAADKHSKCEDAEKIQEHFHVCVSLLTDGLRLKICGSGTRLAAAL